MEPRVFLSQLRALSAARSILSALLMVLTLLPQTGLFAQSNTVWRCIDSTGRARYTNVAAETAGQQCAVVTREVMVAPSPPPAVRAPLAPSSTAAADPAAQRSREGARRRILDDELKSEQAALARARELLAEQEGIRNGDERNYQRVLDRLQPFQDSVANHLKNVDALEREINRLK